MNAVTRPLFGFDEHSPGNELKQDASGQEINSFRAMQLTAEGLEVTKVEIRLTPGPRDCKVHTSGGSASAAGYDGPCVGIVPLSLGTGVLEKLHMYFALKEGALYFSTAAATQD